MSETNSLVTEITDDNFDGVVSSGVTLVDFWAPWCFPCRSQTPILEKVAEKIGDKAQICKFNVDDHNQIPMKLGVAAIPTLMIFKNGEVQHKMVGLQDENTLIQALESLG